MRRTAALALAGSLLLAGCSAGAQPTATVTVTMTPSATPTPTPTASAPSATVVSSGFGQQGQLAWVSAIVHNDTNTVGQAVTVNFNVLDAAGALVKSASQVEFFSQPDADHILGAQVELPAGVQVDRVEATVAVDKRATFAQPFPVLPVTTPVFGSDQMGQEVSFEVTNPTSVNLQTPRLGIACMDASNRIIGGGSDYPDLIAPGSKVRVEARVVTSGTPASCIVHSGAPVDWGTHKPAPTSAAPIVPGTPEAAFKTWVEQIGTRDWAGQYENLAGPQKKLLSESQFVSCRTRNPIPLMTWEQLVSVEDIGMDTIAGTTEQFPSKLVTAQLDTGSQVLPIPVHMYDEGGRWTWSLTDEALKTCR